MLLNEQYERVPVSQGTVCTVLVHLKSKKTLTPTVQYEVRAAILELISAELPLGFRYRCRQVAAQSNIGRQASFLDCNGENMTDNQEGSIELRCAMQHAIVEICGAEEEESGSSMTAPAIKALAELTFLYASTSLASDLDAFSTHANRKTITVDDVKLVVRKNPSVVRKLEDCCDNLASTSGKVGSRKTILKENKNAPYVRFNSSSDDNDTDEDARSIQGGSKPAVRRNVESHSRKRARPVTAKRPVVQSDSSTDESDAKNEFEVQKKKSSRVESNGARPISAKGPAVQSDSSANESDEENKFVAQKKKSSTVKQAPIEVDDSSTSTHESTSIPAKKKQSSHLISSLLGTLSFSEEEQEED